MAQNIPRFEKPINTYRPTRRGEAEGYRTVQSLGALSTGTWRLRIPWPNTLVAREDMWGILLFN